MPVRPPVSYPGVYVQEIPSGVRTIIGVSTSIAVFIGRAKQGPLDEPVLCQNFSDFERAFSSAYAGSDMARAVRLAFQNGATQIYAMRIADGATYSEVTLNGENGAPVLTVRAKSPGVVGDTIRLGVTYEGLYPESTFNMELFRWESNSTGSLVKTDVENWQNLSMDPDHARYVADFVNQNSNLVEIEDLDAAAGSPSAGYSQSGRVFSDTPEVFWRHWRNQLSTVGLSELGTPWTGAQITTSGSYTGSAQKTITFTVTVPGTIGTDDITINRDDGVDPIYISSSYTTGTWIDISEGVRLSFGAGSLVASESFTVTIHPPTSRFRIGVDGKAPVDVDLSGLDFDNDSDLDSTNAINNLASRIESTINNLLPTGSIISANFQPVPATSAQGGMLRITSANGDIKIEPAATNDIAGALMLGSAQGGIEVSRYSQYRPAPTGMVFSMGANLVNLVTFSAQVQTAFRIFRIDTTDIDLADSLETSGAADRMYQDGYLPSKTNNSDGVREKWTIIADAVNDKRASDPSFRWSAEVWGSRLALIPSEGGDNYEGNIHTSGGDDVDIGPGDLNLFTQNVRYYSLGPSGLGNFQTPAGAPASDGNAPTLNDYRNAFEKLDKEVDLFNLMILPKDDDHSEGTTTSLWGPASQFCQKRRAFLLMDPPISWKTVQQATHPSTGVNSLRVGIVKDHAALFYPRVTIIENGLRKFVGPSGAIAGLMARIDSSRGVWKASAGIEADLRGIVGLEYKFSDGENGVLNPRAVNTLRLFPNGIVTWGARTMDGDDNFGSEYKYIPVRRIALFIEESLFRGLKWVVFEPNAEPLWAQIRLNVGAFMHDLFRQGAFKGEKPKDAYFVKCDSETTTQNDINLGIVNIWVGFAPLKPAEFVILYLQQMTGQIET
jgi:phage tail sheath protein FI